MRPSWFLLAVFLTVALPAPAGAEVVPVPMADGSDNPTQTFLWESPRPKVVLIIIPGGEGYIGLRSERSELGGFYGKTFRPLADPALTSGQFHVVIFDSPYPLPTDRTFPASRISGDHQRRIETVVRFYRQRFGKPVWLLGHSNGAISVAEFLRTQRELVDGAIFSSSRVGVKVSADVGRPILFLHHRQDLCTKANPAGDIDLYESLRAGGKTDLDFVWVEGGMAGQGDICHSGHHMYNDSEEAAYRAVDQFIAGR